MRPLVNAVFAGRFSDFLRFDLESGWQCRIVVLADDLVRVLFLRNGTLKEPRRGLSRLPTLRCHGRGAIGSI